MGSLLAVLASQAGNLQETGADDVLLCGRQGGLFDLGDAFHIVHGADDGDGGRDFILLVLSAGG